MIEKLYTWNAEDLIKDIDAVYAANEFCTVNFLYFANAVQYHLLESNTEQTIEDKVYAHALIESDFLLPDWIALQVWWYFNRKPKMRLQNLNWTDFTPKILSYFSQKYTVHLYIYSLYDEKIQKSQEWLHKATQKLTNEYGIDIIHAYQSHFNQRWQDFPWDDMEHNVDTSGNVINIFLNCTWSPFQEKRTEKNKDWFQKNKMMVLNVGWFLDFYSWFEKRAPERVVKAKVLETFWRVASNPKKNLKKFVAMFWVFRLLGKKLFTRN